MASLSESDRSGNMRSEGRQLKRSAMAVILISSIRCWLLCLDWITIFRKGSDVIVGVGQFDNGVAEFS